MVSAETEARAFILDLLSVSFAYPTIALYESLLNGDYVEELLARVSHLATADELASLIGEISAYRDNDLSSDFNAFQSEYISLFEHNKNTQPLHLNAHLYSEAEPQPVPVYQRLQKVYRSFGIEMASDRATEQADHLSVQLEFFAYLHRLLLGENDEAGRQKIKTALSAFCIELEWTRPFVDKLLQREAHTFYHPLAQLLLLMLDMCCEETRL